MVESLSFEGLKNNGDMALRDIVSSHGGDGLGSVWIILEVFSNLMNLWVYDSNIRLIEKETYKQDFFPLQPNAKNTL